MAKETANIIADFRTSLATKIAVAGTTGTLMAFLDDDLVALPVGRYFFTIDKDNGQKEHISCDLDGTAMTNIKTVARGTGVETAGVLREHRIGASVVITDFAHIKKIQNLLDGTTDLDGSTPLKYDADPTITDDKELATKKYIDDLALAGAPIASTTIEGVTKLSVAPAADPIAVGDNDPRLPTEDEADAMAGTGTPSAANKFVTETDANLTNNVKTSGDQSVAGVKTFTSIPVLPASDPTTDNQAARKAYVDALVAESTGSVVDGTATIYYSKRGKSYYNLRIIDSVRIQGNGYPCGLYPDQTTAERICTLLSKTYSSHYSLIIWVGIQTGAITGQWNGTNWTGEIYGNSNNYQSGHMSLFNIQ